jgi:hypothetical protein
MPQSHLAFEITELLHLELECSSCHTTAILPPVQLHPDPTKQIGQFALIKCPWCNNESIFQHKDLVQNLMNVLFIIKANKDLRLRFVFQDHFRNSE